MTCGNRLRSSQVHKLTRVSTSVWQVLYGILMNSTQLVATEQVLVQSIGVERVIIESKKQAC